MLIPVDYLQNPDYENSDGTWTRYPSQLFIESDIRKQTAQETILLQYKSRVEALEAALRKIASGDGVYGQQAAEYKQIAKEALGE